MIRRGSILLLIVFLINISLLYADDPLSKGEVSAAPAKTPDKQLSDQITKNPAADNKLDGYGSQDIKKAFDQLGYNTGEISGDFTGASVKNNILNLADGSQIDLKSGKKININVLADGINLDDGDKFCFNCKGIVYDSQKFSAKSGDVVYSGTSAKQVKSFSGQQQTQAFSVESADAITTKNLAITNLENSQFELSDGVVTKSIMQGENLHTTIKDASLNIEISANKNITGIRKVEFSKTPDGYSFKSIGLIHRVYTKTYVESIVSHGEIIYLVDVNDGVYELEFNDASTYFQNFKGTVAEKTRSYGFGLPEKSDKYKIIFDKPSKHLSLSEFQATFNNTKNVGYVSLIEHKILLNGIIDYYRYGFEVADTGTIKIVKETDLGMHKIYEGLHEGNVAVINLDNNNIYAGLDLSVGKFKFFDLLYKIHFDDMFVYGVGSDSVNGSVEVERYADWEHTKTPLVLTKFTENNFDLSLDKGIVKKLTGNNTITFFSASDNSKKILNQTIVEYNSLNPECAAYDEEYFVNSKDKDKTILNLLSVLSLFLLIPISILRKEIKKNKGQIAFFLVLAVIIMMVIGMTIFVVSRISIQGAEKNTQFQQAKQTVLNYVDNCNEENLKCSLHRAGLNGGNIIYPSKKTSIIAIQDYIEESINSCISKFPNNFGFQLSIDKSEAEIIFNDESSQLLNKQKIKISNSGTYGYTDKFSANIPIRFKTLQNYENQIKSFDKLKMNQNHINLNVLTSSGLNTELYEISGKTTYIFNEYIKDDQYKYLFLVG